MLLLSVFAAYRLLLSAYCLLPLEVRAMRRCLLMLLLVCASVALLLPALKSSSATLVDESERRKPFSLELPDIASGPITAPEATIPTAELHTLRLRVANPYAEGINYGKLFTKINGESAGTIQNIY